MQPTTELRCPVCLSPMLRVPNDPWNRWACQDKTCFISKNAVPLEVAEAFARNMKPLPRMTATPFSTKFRNLFLAVQNYVKGRR